MCFIKTSAPQIDPVMSTEVVQRKQADASLTKNSQIESKQGYQENIKTSAIGLGDFSNSSNKKTLLGE